MQALQTLWRPSHAEKLASRFLVLYGKHVGRYKMMQNFCHSSRAGKCTTRTSGTGNKAIASHTGLRAYSHQLAATA